jgi:CBS domain-containing protein
MRVSDVCQRHVVAITPESSVIDAAKRMREMHVGDLVVVVEKGGGEKPVGIITDRDLVVDVLATAHTQLERLTVGEVMTEALTTAKLDESVVTLLSRMRDRGVRRIPVVDDDGLLAGIVSIDDVIELVAEMMREMKGLYRSQPRLEAARES